MHPKTILFHILGVQYISKMLGILKLLQIEFY
jgi:hypothetical protein